MDTYFPHDYLRRVAIYLDTKSIKCGSTRNIQQMWYCFWAIRKFGFQQNVQMKVPEFGELASHIY